MLSDTLQNALNKQIAEEAYASDYYLSMASWCEVKGLPGTASFLYDHALKEREHMMKLFRYVNAAGGHALLQKGEQALDKFKSLLNVLELVLEHEISVTACINKLVDVCLKEKDYSTFNFLQWYVAEQHEDERLLKSLLDLIKMAGTEGRGLFLVDHEIGKLTNKRA